MTSKYDKIAVSSPEMFSGSPSWFIPHRTATVFLVIGNIYPENYINNDSKLQRRKMLNVTLSFDHGIIDGAQAARFITLFEEILSSETFIEI